VRLDCALMSTYGIPPVGPQGIFSDAFASAVMREHSYAFTWLHSPQAFTRDGGGGALHWPPSGFTRANASALLGQLWRRSSEMRGLRPRWLLPPLPRRHPQRRPWELSEPVLWNVLRPLEATIGLDAARLAERPDLLPGGLGWLPRASASKAAAAAADDDDDADAGAWSSSVGSRRGVKDVGVKDVGVKDVGVKGAAVRPRAPRCHSSTCAMSTLAAPPAEDMAEDMVGAAPDWLHCTTGHWMVTAGWPASRRPVCTALHLVESRSQFAHYGSLDTLKANRPYVLGAYGHWDAFAAEAHRRVPSSVPTSSVPPAIGTFQIRQLRAIRLGPEFLEAAAASEGVGVLLNALQLLAALAAITGRVPVVPRVDCASRWLKRHPMTISGVADDYVLQIREGAGVAHLRERAAAAAAAPAEAAAAPAEAMAEEADEVADVVSCHLAMGGAGCHLPIVLPAWQVSAMAPWPF